MASKQDLLHDLWGQHTRKMWGPLFKKHSKYQHGNSTALNEVLGPSQHGAKLPQKPALILLPGPAIYISPPFILPVR